MISGKKAALLVTCAGQIEGNCDAIKSIFKGFTDYLNLETKGDYILPFCTTPESIGDEGDELSEILANSITKEKSYGISGKFFKKRKRLVLTRQLNNKP